LVSEGQQGGASAVRGFAGAPASGSAAAAPGGGSPLLCADIGGSFIHAALVGDDGVPVDNRRVPTPAGDFAAFAAALRDVAAGYGAALAPTAPLVLSIAALVEPETGYLVSANIPCLNGRPAIAEIAQLLGRPVDVVNDADSFTLAEALTGVGAGHRVVFGAILGTGVGGGLVIDGRPVRGRAGVAGEWGHGPIVNQRTRSGRDLPRLKCGCGQRGCLDTFGGARGLERLDAHLNGRMVRDSRAILAAWHAGEAAAAETMAAYLDIVAEPLALVVNVTGASIVPLGGGLSADPALVAALDRNLRDRILRPAAAPIVVRARYHEDAGLRGAALLRRALSPASAPYHGAAGQCGRP
jgi:N-acetylglucosamine kinase